MESGASHQEPAVAPLEAIAWDDVPLDGMGGFHTFEPDEFRIVQERMLDLFVKRFRSCGTAAKPPQTWESSFELRLAPVEGGYVIRDAILRRANYGLAELEACFREAYVGQTITVDVTTGPIRIEEPVRFVVPMMPNGR